MHSLDMDLKSPAPMQEFALKVVQCSLVYVTKTIHTLQIRMNDIQRALFNIKYHMRSSFFRAEECRGIKNRQGGNKERKQERQRLT